MCNNQPYGFPSDVWSLGIVLYELLSLDVPFRSRDVVALVSQVRSQPGVYSTTLEKHPNHELPPERHHTVGGDLIWQVGNRLPLWKVWAGRWEGGIDLKLPLCFCAASPPCWLNHRCNPR